MTGNYDQDLNKSYSYWAILLSPERLNHAPLKAQIVVMFVSALIQIVEVIVGKSKNFLIPIQ